MAPSSKPTLKPLLPRIDAPVARPLNATAGASQGGPAVDACGNVQPSSGYGVLELTMK